MQWLVMDSNHGGDEVFKPGGRQTQQLLALAEPFLESQQQCPDFISWLARQPLHCPNI